jgi:hypothetical protein
VHLAQQCRQIRDLRVNGNFLLSALALKPLAGQTGTARDSGFSDSQLREEELKDDTMKIRTISAAGLMMALAGCTTVSMPVIQANPVEAYWSGQSAGKFFAAFGPPISDHDDGGGRVYNWRGGYKTAKVQPQLDANGAPKKGSAAGRTVHLSCKADITTNSDYVIRSIHIIGDMPGTTSSSYCAELLVPAKPAGT